MKNIVVLFDGTWSRWDEAYITNVGLMRDMLVPHQSRTQCVYYASGVGSSDLPLLAGAFGWGLQYRLKRAYEYVCRNYEPGDRIYLFGFSRGAFTARSFAGMLAHSGIAVSANKHAFKAAWKAYRNRSTPKLTTYPKTHVLDIYLGVWDTVGSMGIPLFSWDSLVNFRHRFHDLHLSPYVRAGYHMMAYHEQRNVFTNCPWEKPQGDRDIQQEWYPGWHGDVGGGTHCRGISDEALARMLDHANFHGLEVPSNWHSFLVQDRFAHMHPRDGWYWRIFGMQRRKGSVGDREHHSSYLKEYIEHYRKLETGQ